MNRLDNQHILNLLHTYWTNQFATTDFAFFFVVQVHILTNN